MKFSKLNKISPGALAQVLDTGPPSADLGGPGPGGPARGATPWAPGGLSWAERVQLQQEAREQGGPGGWHVEGGTGGVDRFDRW